MAMATVFCDIEELLTLAGAELKQGRGVVAADLSPLRRASIVCKGGKIAWVGESRKLPKEYAKNARRISLKGKTVLPAFTECHTHLVFAGDRSDEFELRNSGVSYAEIARRGGGINSTVKATRAASEKALLDLAQKRVDHFIRQGVTTVEVKSGYGLSLKDESKLLRIARKLRKARVVTTYLGAHAVPPEAASNESYLQNLIDRDLAVVAKKKLADRADIFIEGGFFSPEQASRYFTKARDLGLRLTAHADQLSRTGAGVLAADFHAQSADHLVRISPQDVAALAKSPTVAVLLPAADAYMRIPYPPARPLLDAGGRVALATDFNPGSSPTQDLAYVGLLARLEMKMSLPEVIVAYTLNAAAALGLADELGSLTVGKNCDFAVLDADWKQLFYSVGAMPVAAVWREGRRLWSSGSASSSASGSASRFWS